MGAQGQLLDGARLFLRNLGWADVLRPAAGARIQKRILVREIVETAFGNDLDNWERQVAQNSNGQLPARDKFFHEELAIVDRSVGNGGIHLAFISNDVHADRRALTRRLDYERNGDRRPLAERNDLPIRRRDALLTERFLGADLVEG